MTEEVRPRRADARRNEEKIVEAALVQFSNHGVNASLDGIAKQAGVGPGTLYRHFPTRGHIIASALGACHEQFRDVRKSLLTSENSLDALQEWLVILRNYVRTFDGLAVLLLHAANDPTSALSTHCSELLSITQEILARAQKSGLAKPTVTAESLLMAQFALSCVEGHTAAPNFCPESLNALLREGYASPDAR